MTRHDAARDLAHQIGEVGTTTAYQDFHERHRADIEAAALAVLISLIGELGQDAVMALARMSLPSLEHGADWLGQGQPEPCCMMASGAYAVYNAAFVPLGALAYLLHCKEQER